ncbi:MAG: archease [Candidatus Lokiarchaeota archaeon]|nr:archease [Candidatus Lokiarchaeota archaeon]
MKKSGFEFEDHTADVQARCWGINLEDAFAQTAYALMATITPDLKKISKNVSKTFKVTSEDKEALLFDFLSEFLFYFDVEGLVFNEINITSINKKNDQYELTVILLGEEFNKEIHEIGTEVKAITYSFMKIEEKDNYIEIRIVFDI